MKIELVDPGTPAYRKYKVDCSVVGEDTIERVFDNFSDALAWWAQMLWYIRGTCNADVELRGYNDSADIPEWLGTVSTRRER